MAQQSWDRNAAKNLFRSTCQRLGQIQEKNDSQANITRRDISKLLQENNVSLARAKAQKLIQDDAFGDVLEILGMHTGILIEHVHELEPTTSPSPIIVEAASTVIYASYYLDLKDLHVVRDQLAQRLGENFIASAVGNRDRHVSPRAVAALSPSSPTVGDLDMYLFNIAKSHGVTWHPEPRRQDIVKELSEILDPQGSPLVDLPRLRTLCSKGIPDHPPWLRPRLWKIFFGVLPVLKSSWTKEINTQRTSYYDLVRRILASVEDAPGPKTPFSHSDKALLEVSRQLSRIPPILFTGLTEEPEANALCPLDESSPPENKIPCADALYRRLKALRSQGTDTDTSSSDVPEIRLEFETPVQIPATSLSRRVQPPPTLSSKSLSEKVHDKHMIALGRILYIHFIINPGNSSPHIPTLLVPIYTAMLKEVEPSDAAHIEADTFWLFETLVSEFSELEDEQGGIVWMKRLSERLMWADIDLYDSLDRKGLNPALPHYSYRWLAPILAHTFSLPDTLVAWDAIFAHEARQKDSSPRLEFLIDICAAMIIRAKVALLRLGKNVPKSPGLWGHEEAVLPPPSPLRPWELGDAFLEGTTLLQNYPIVGAGGVDSVLQSAADLWNRREDEAQAARGASLSLGERLKVTLWKGFTNQVSSPDISPAASDGEASDDEARTVPPSAPPDSQSPTIASGLTSRLTTSVWQGFTNQRSTAETPLASPSSVHSTILEEPFHTSSPASAGQDHSPLESGSITSSLWDYAEKLKDSDAAASLAKVSTNWRAKAFNGSWGLRGKPAATSSSAIPEQFLSPPSRVLMASSQDQRRGSLPGPDRTSIYSPPARPTHFKAPRDSVIFPSGGALSVPTSPESNGHHEGDFSSVFNRTKHIQDSIASLTKASPITPKKAGPRPLLLNARSLITERSSTIIESKTATSKNSGDWSEVNLSKLRRGHGRRQDSQSSMSSLAPSDALRNAKMEYDSEGRSRRVLLNRKSVSPMAPHFRHNHESYSSGTSPDNGLRDLSFSSNGDIAFHGSEKGLSPVFAPSLYSPPLPTHIPVLSSNESSGLSDPEVTVGQVVPVGVQLFDPPVVPRKLTRKKTPPPMGDTSEDSYVPEAPSRSPKVRSRKQMARPSALRLQEQERPASLEVPFPDEEGHTPKAAEFDGDELPSPRLQRRTQKVSTGSAYDGAEGGRVRKLSGESRSRKISSEGRARKVSTETYRPSRRVRDSVADEGDDEGYDDLLSAYESEDGRPKTFLDD